MEKSRTDAVRVLMIGWEFPPFITGGLGTACYGLTRAMDRRGMEVVFVLPKPTDGEEATHVRLLSPAQSVPSPQPPGTSPPTAETKTQADHDANEDQSRRDPVVEHVDSKEAPERPATASPDDLPSTAEPFTEPFQHVRFIGIPADVFPVYEPPVREDGEEDDTPVESESGGGERGEVASVGDGLHRESALRHTPARADSDQAQHSAHQHAHESPSPREQHSEQESSEAPRQQSADTDYEGDIMTIVDRYADFCLKRCRNLDFDVIHVHDWMTYPAGMRVARATGKPLVAHIHSTEFDRSGEQVNPQIYDLERRGMHAAMRVVAVSQLTKNVVMNKYHLPDERIEVVYNGVDLEPGDVGITGIRSKDKIVLYFGRITYQKGPEYFIKAAHRVLEVMPDVKFVVAGSGDLAKRMIEMAAELGIGHKVLFTGFLRGDDIKRVFNLADLYVMPSISEPFGIAPLEAMSHNVPVLISRSSGVSEVLDHALKVDFWDVDDMANKIVAVLRHPPLSEMLKEHGAFEVRRLTWDGAAERCEQMYRQVIREMA